MKLSNTDLLLGWPQSMIELSRTQDEEVGDGTTSVIILGMFLVCVYINFIYLLFHVLASSRVSCVLGSMDTL